MKDTISQQVQSLDNIPDIGTRITILVIIIIVLAIGCLLIYFKMKEADKKIGF